jgi:hypothetical protein
MLLTSMAAGAQIASLPDEAWNGTEWICVADAPEVQGRVDEDTRAADGACWSAEVMYTTYLIKPFICSRYVWLSPWMLPIVSLSGIVR